MSSEYEKLRRELNEAAQHKVLISVTDSLEMFTDQELRDELKRRAMARKAANVVLRSVFPKTQTTSRP